ncbi:MAG: hypothetical protein RLZ98_210 [Pseudomonadota bacterium]
MRIWLVTVGEEIPEDPGTPRLLRTGILARHLADRGHDVTWWNSTFNHQQKIQRSDATVIRDTAERYRLVLLHGRSYGRNVSLARILNHRDIARSFEAEVRSQARPDVIVCSYPTIELADAVVGYACKYSVPIAVDFRDMWPDALAEVMPLPVRILAAPLLAHWRASQRRIVERATAILGITDAFVAWALGSTGRGRSDLDRAFHLTVDTQSPPADALAKANAFWGEQGVHGADDQVIGCFMGSIARREDLLAVVRAAAKLEAGERARLRLVFCGSDDLMRDIAAVSVGDPVVLTAGWRNAAEIRSLLQRSNFGMLPYPSTADFRMSLPNKVGEYLSAGLPIMTGLQGETHAFLKREGLGLFYAEGDCICIRDCLSEIVADTGRISALRPRALAAYKAGFDAATIYRSFCDHIEFLATAGRGR